MKTILMISDDFFPAATGVGIHLQLMSKSLVSQGFKVCILTSRREGQAKKEIWNGITVYRSFSLKLFGFYQALPSRRLIDQIVKSEKPEIVHFHYLSYLFLKVFYSIASLNIKKIYTYHMTEDHLTQPLPMRPFRGLSRSLIKYFCNKMDVIISPSQNLKNKIIQSGIQTTTEWINNPVEFKKTKINSSKIESTKNFSILFAGRLALEKNIPFLLKAVARLKEKGLQLELKIAGHGPERSNLESLCKNLNIDKQVIFLGQLEHQVLAQKYAECDVFVLPSLVETQGLVAMEAMQFAKPIIVTDKIVSAKELVEEGKNGYIVNSDSVEDLAGKLLLLAENQELREQLGAYGEKMTKAFQLEPVTQKLIDLYNFHLGQSETTKKEKNKLTSLETFEHSAIDRDTLSSDIPRPR